MINISDDKYNELLSGGFESLNSIIKEIKPVESVEDLSGMLDIVDDLKFQLITIAAIVALAKNSDG